MSDVGIYNINGKNMETPTVVSAPARSINVAAGVRFSVVTSSNLNAYVSGAGGLTGVSVTVDYGYVHGEMTVPPSMSAYRSGGVLLSGSTGSGDYNNGFVATVYQSRQHEAIRFGAYLSGSEPIENKLMTPRRDLYYVGSRGLRYFWHNGYGFNHSATFDFVTAKYLPRWNTLYGHTRGITTSSAETDFAVYVRLTGALSATLSASSIFDPSWFLSQTTGSWAEGKVGPFIPYSSSTIGNTSPEQIDAEASRQIFNETVGLQKTISQANDSSGFLNRMGYGKTTAELWSEADAAIAASTSSGTP